MNLTPMILRFSYSKICQLSRRSIELQRYWLQFYYTMNSEQMINSIYNPKKKQRQPFVFPKITKADPSPPSNKVFVRGGGGRKYNQQNIFKIEDEKRQKVKLHIEEQRMRELRNRQCEQLQQRMAEMARKHHDQMRQIDQAEKLLTAQIEAAKKQQYDHKLGLWELKNEIMNLNSIYLDEENQYKRLCDELDYVDPDAHPDDPHPDDPEPEYCDELNQQEEQEGQYQDQQLEGLGFEGDQGKQAWPRDVTQSLKLQSQQLQICSQLQPDQESHSVI